MVAQDKDLAKQLIQEAQDKKNSLIQLKAKKAANKSGNGSIPFDADAYSQARKDAAVWAKTQKMLMIFLEQNVARYGAMQPMRKKCYLWLYELVSQYQRTIARSHLLWFSSRYTAWLR